MNARCLEMVILGSVCAKKGEDLIAKHRIGEKLLQDAGEQSGVVNLAWNKSRIVDVHITSLAACYLPGGGCQSSTLFPSGSSTQPNFPYSDSSTFSMTLQPSALSAFSRS